MQFTFFFGCLAVIQMLFLPGYLLLKAFRIQASLLQRILLIPSLSLLANYVGILLLVSFHLYLPLICKLIILIELIMALIVLDRSQEPALIKQFTQQIIGLYQAATSVSQPAYVDVVKTFVVSAALIMILAFIGLGYHLAGTIFMQWDPVMSYNQWATQWAHNHIAEGTWHYPQLLPANWSLAYVLMGQSHSPLTLEFFPKLIMAFFPLGILLVIFTLATEKRQFFYLMAVLAAGLGLVAVVKKNLLGGWVDCAVTFHALLFIAMLKMMESQRQQLKRWIFLMALVVAGGALTKQAGLYLLLLFPLLVFFSARPMGWTQQILKPTFIAWGLAWLITLSWYGYIQWQIHQGVEQSQISFLTSSIYHVFKHLNHAIILFFLLYWIGLPTLLLYVLAALPKKDPFWRMIQWTVFIPYTLIWLIFLSYSLRNLTLTVPFMAILSALEIKEALQPGRYLHRWTGSLSHLLKQTRGIYYFVILLTLLLLISQSNVVAPKALLNAQISLIQQRGEAATLNNLLLTYQKQHGFKGKILTAWDYLGHNPYFKDDYLPWQPGNVTSTHIQSTWMIDPHNLKPYLKKNPARYILSAPNIGLQSQAFTDYLQTLAQQQKLKPLISLPHFILYEIMTPIEQL